MTTHARATSSRGVSLLEVIVALTILGFVMAGILAIVWQGAVRSRKIRAQTLAYQVAQGVLETYTDWARLDALDGASNGVVTNGTYTNPPTADQELAQVTLNSVVYTSSLQIADGPSLSPPNVLKRLTVTVSWSNGSVVLVSLKANCCPPI